VVAVVFLARPDVESGREADADRLDVLAARRQEWSVCHAALV
jgi:hypothetical protein